MYWISHSNLKGPLLCSLWKGLLIELWASDLHREGEMLMQEQKSQKYSRSLQHDTAHTGHGAQAVRGVLDGQGLILKDGTNQCKKSLKMASNYTAIRWRQSTSAELSKGIRLVKLLCWKAVMTHMSCKFFMSLKSIEVQSRGEECFVFTEILFWQQRKGLEVVTQQKGHLRQGLKCTKTSVDWNPQSVLLLAPLMRTIYTDQAKH